MPKRLFVDTSYVLALFNTADEFHEKAKELKDLTSRPNTLVTTEAILLEIGNSLAKQNVRQKGATIINGFYKSENIEVASITTALIKEGLEFFEKRQDKDWGLTDCISFVVMHKYGIRQALAADDHFTQAGFKALLLE
jgi:uncharacterized protein